MEIIIICLSMAQKLLNLKQGFRNCTKSPLFWKHFRRLFCGQYEKTGLYGSVFDFSVDYRVTAVDDILDIHKF